MTWQDEDNTKDLRALVDMVWEVEAIPVSQIVELCDWAQIEHRNFQESWEALLDASHEIINRAEDLL